MSIESVMPSNYLILCCPLLLPPSIFPSIRVFSTRSVLPIRCPKDWSLSFSISPFNEHPGLISFRMDWLDLLAVQGTLKSLLQHHSLKASIRPGRGRSWGHGCGATWGKGRGGGPDSAITPARRPQDVFLMIWRHKTTIFTDAKESSTVFELKRIVEGTLKQPPDEQWLYKDDQLLDDGKTLGECGFTSQTARPQAPSTVGLAFRADEAFKALRIKPFSSPPELPDVMKPQDSGSSANEQAVQ
ncbi:uncharacterized protein [Bos mutus]|uniref:uncharacterized protein n=1 Tax=Bos mutus TaxID=72004 RepID=UPI0038B4670C